MVIIYGKKIYIGDKNVTNLDITNAYS